MKASLFICTLTLGAASCYANAILLPGGTETVVGTSTTGTSFTYSGTLTQNDTLALTESGSPCLQTGVYCTNGAGVVTVAGTTGVGGTSTFGGTFNGTTSTWNYGSLLIEISGQGTKQIFSANAADGLGSGAPPQTFTLASTSLASLGFGSFSVANPTITFIMADDLYTDNSGQFTLRQSTAVPEPSTGFLVLAVAGVALILMRFTKKTSAIGSSGRC